MKSNRMLAATLAAALFAATPGFAVEPGAPAPRVGDGVAQGLVPITNDQLAQFFKSFKVASINIQTPDNAALKKNPAVLDILNQVMGPQAPAGAPPAAARPARAAAEAAQAPSTGTARDARDPDLPMVFNFGPELRQHQHQIFYDTSDERFQVDWPAQTQLLRAQLRRLGVPEENISITPLSTREDFFCQLTSVEGSRHIYFFGHGSPLTMHIGNEEVHMAQDAAALQQSQVRLVAHYGCNFVDVNNASLAPVQRNLQPGTRIVLVGHRDVSYPTDDRHADPTNPLVRVALTPNGTSMHNLSTELTDRVAPTIASLLSMPANPVGSLVGAAVNWHLGDYRGRTPTTLADDARARAAARRP